MPSVELTGTEVSIAARAPLSSLHLTMRHLGGAWTDPVFSRRLQGTLTPEMRATLAPMLGAPTSNGVRRMFWGPSVITPIVEDSPNWANDAADAIVEAAPEELLDGLAFIHGTITPPARWRAAVDNPRGWLRALGETMRVANAAFAEVWDSTSARRELEHHILSDLLAPGSTLDAMTGFVPVLKVESQHLTLGAPDGLVVRPQPRIEVVPMVSSAGGYVLSSAPDRIQVGYSIQGVLAARTTDVTNRDPLAELLGSVRAHVLRYLDHPRTMAEIAAAVGKAPSTVTVHSRVMVQTGLVQRVELGNRAWLVRTPRGTELLYLFADTLRPVGSSLTR